MSFFEDQHDAWMENDQKGDPQDYDTSEIARTESITLDGGAVVTIPAKYDYSHCKRCKRTDIIWAKTRRGKNMPIRWDGEKWISHFSDCPKADEFRNRTRP